MNRITQKDEEIILKQMKKIIKKDEEIFPNK